MYQQTCQPSKKIRDDTVLNSVLFLGEKVRLVNPFLHFHSSFSRSALSLCAWVNQHVVSVSDSS